MLLSTPFHSPFYVSEGLWFTKLLCSLIVILNGASLFRRFLSFPLFLPHRAECTRVVEKSSNSPSHFTRQAQLSILTPPILSPNKAGSHPKPTRGSPIPYTL